MFKLVVNVRNVRLLNYNFQSVRIFAVLQLSNVQATQQPQTITIPTGSFQFGGNSQQIVQLTAPTKMQTNNAASSQNGTVVMVRTIYFTVLK